MRPLTFARLLLYCFYLAVILFFVMVLALKLGAVPVSLYGLAADLLQVLFHRTSALSSNYDMIVIDIRLPRIALGIIVGASLAVAGAAFQALLRNPLADPYVLGVSSGAALGAIVTLIAQPYLALPMARRGGDADWRRSPARLQRSRPFIFWVAAADNSTATLLLAGIVSASFLSAIIMFLMTTLSAERDLRGMAFWLMGDLPGTLPIQLRWLLCYPISGRDAGAIYTTSSDLNLMLNGRAGSEAPGRERDRGEARGLHRGVDPDGARGFGERRDRLRGVVGAARDADDCLATDYRLLIPTSAFGGAIAIVLADTLARTVVCSERIARRRDDGSGRSAVFLFLLRRKFA